MRQVYDSIDLNGYGSYKVVSTYCQTQPLKHKNSEQ